VRQLEQPFLRGRGRDPGERAHLDEGELAAGEGRPDRRQLAERLGDPQVLARLAAREPEAEGEPARRLVGEVARARDGEGELEEAGEAGVQVGGERRQLVLELERVFDRRPRCLY
jgi:hypothetical protein